MHAASLVANSKQGESPAFRLYEPIGGRMQTCRVSHHATLMWQVRTMHQQESTRWKGWFCPCLQNPACLKSGSDTLDEFSRKSHAFCGPYHLFHIQLQLKYMWDFMPLVHVAYDILWGELHGCDDVLCQVGSGGYDNLKTFKDRVEIVEA